MKINKEYKEITSEIVNDAKFLELKDDSHHDQNCYDVAMMKAYAKKNGIMIQS